MHDPRSAHPLFIGYVVTLLLLLPAIGAVTYLVACQHSLTALFSLVFCVLLYVANTHARTLSLSVGIPLRSGARRQLCHLLGREDDDAERVADEAGRDESERRADEDADRRHDAWVIARNRVARRVERASDGARVERQVRGVLLL